LTAPKAEFACGSMVRFYLCFTKILHEVQNFCETKLVSSALPEAISAFTRVTA
jgi:hypothetical protein